MANMFISIKKIQEKAVLDFDAMVERSVSDRAKIFTQLVPILARFSNLIEIIKVLEAYLDEKERR